MIQCQQGSMIDPLDGRLLLQLQQDSRQSNQQLADTVGMSSSACWRRVAALEAAGIITRYAALVDREKAGFAMSAIVHVSLHRHDEQFVSQFVLRVQRRAEVLECFATTGDADFHLRVVVSDMAAYNRFLDDFLFKIPGVRHVRTNVILKEIKYDVTLPY
jgi:Lrp/AsnC family transcriptional regulator, leucine-responsive regulatory protein